MRLIGNGGIAQECDRNHPYLTNSAVVVRAGRAITLRELDVSACRSACILTEHDTRDVVIERDTISGSTWDGVSLNRTARARMVGNTIRDNIAAGITTEHLEDSVIEHNVVADNRTHGIYLADSYRNVVDGNRFAGNVDAGVFLTCAVRDRDPAPVRCWDASMSQANRFKGNEFVGNRRAFVVAADAAADCRAPGFVPNVSRHDRFPGGAAIDGRTERFGRCLEAVVPPAARAVPR
jgi:parallel beta-helix repeat protein